MQLFPHQEQVLNQTKDFNRVAYYLDMGLGKTFVGSEKMKQLETKLNILVCQKSKIDDWMEHFRKYYPTYDVEDLTKKNDFDCFMSTWDIDAGYMVGVINYDLLFRKSDFLQLYDFTLMLDESSTIQNEKAKRSKFILKMKPANVILLSGTPTSGKYENLWSQINMLGWDISNKTYNKQYVNWVKSEHDGYIHNIVNKDNPYKNVDRLKRKMREHGAVFMKTEECFDLPEQNFIEIATLPHPNYKKFIKNRIINIEGIELVGDTNLTKLLYSRQLCGQYSTSKLQAFKDLCESTQDRLIVFYNYNAELAALKKIAKELERSISEVNGHVRDLNEYENEETSITFIQYQAGAMGLNLQKANKIIYFTLTDKSELFEQSKKRIHRIGQNMPCFYYLLICKNSIEEQILKALEERRDYTDELFKS